MMSDEIIKDVMRITIPICAYASTQFPTWMASVDTVEPGSMPGVSNETSGGFIYNGM